MAHLPAGEFAGFIGKGQAQAQAQAQPLPLPLPEHRLPGGEVVPERAAAGAQSLPEVPGALAPQGVTLLHTLGAAFKAGVQKAAVQVASATLGELAGAMAGASLESMIDERTGDGALPMLAISGAGVLLVGCLAGNRAGRLLQAASGRELHHLCTAVTALAPLAVAFATHSAPAGIAIALTGTLARQVSALVRDGINAAVQGAVGDTRHVDGQGRSMERAQTWEARGHAAALMALPMNTGVAAAGQFSLNDALRFPGSEPDGRSADSPEFAPPGDADIATDSVSPASTFATRSEKALASGLVRGGYQLVAESTRAGMAIASGGGLDYRPGRGRDAIAGNLSDRRNACLAADHASMRIAVGTGSDLISALGGRVAQGSSAERLVQAAASFIGAVAETRSALVEAGQAAREARPPLEPVSSSAGGIAAVGAIGAAGIAGVTTALAQGVEAGVAVGLATGLGVGIGIGEAVTRYQQA